MKPIRENILVKPCESDSISEGGIFVPENCRAISNKGVIVAVGNGAKNKPMKVKVGQTAFRVKDWGQEVLIDGELHYLMNQDAIIALQ